MATLFLLCGLPGAGKTTFARQLEKMPLTVRLTPDEWLYQFLADVTDKAELDRLRVPVEAVQWEMAIKLLNLGINIILDWGFWSREQRVSFRRQAETFGARVETHFFDAGREQLAARLAERNADLQPGTFAVSETELERWMPWYEPPGADELALNTV